MIKQFFRKVYVPFFNFIKFRKKRNIKKWRKFKAFYVDDVSIKMLYAREKLLIYHNAALFCKTVAKLYGKKYRLRNISDDELNEPVLIKNDDLYEYTRALFENTDCHNQVSDILIEDIGKVECDVVACSHVKAKQIKESGEKIHCIEPNNSIWIGDIGHQYLDVFLPKEHEVVVDAGAFDGVTESEIYEWGNGNIDKIYAFELDPHNAEVCRDYYDKNGLECVTLIEKGTGSVRETITIDEVASGTSGSRVGSGTRTAELTTIDYECSNEPVTFIKMDVEGAELESLKGAENTIRKNKPRLAICIYHKDEDAYEIPAYILSIVPEYKFCVRHYTSMEWETVLYAAVDNSFVV